MPQDDSQTTQIISSDDALASSSQTPQSTEEECLKGWQQAQANYENLKKQVEKERTSWVAFATEGLILELVPIMEHFERAMNFVPDDKKNDSWVEGLVHIKKQFEDVLAKSGVKRIKTVGEKFDPALHEAVGTTEEGQEPDVVVKEVASGYTLHGKVLGPARVIISK